MWEFGKELVKMRISRLTRNWLAIADPRNRPHEKHRLEFEESLTGWISWVIRDSSQVASDPQNSPPNYILVCLIKIPHYPWNVKSWRSIHKKLLRDETLAKHLRVRNCLPTILYIISLEFPFTPTPPPIHPWEVLSLNIYLTHSKCWEKFWCLWKALEGAIEWWTQSGRIAGFG